MLILLLGNDKWTEAARQALVKAGVHAAHIAMTSTPIAAQRLLQAVKFRMVIIQADNRNVCPTQFAEMLKPRLFELDSGLDKIILVNELSMSGAGNPWPLILRSTGTAWDFSAVVEQILESLQVAGHQLNP